MGPLAAAHPERSRSERWCRSPWLAFLKQAAPPKEEKEIMFPSQSLEYIHSCQTSTNIANGCIMWDDNVTASERFSRHLSLVLSEHCQQFQFTTLRSVSWLLINNIVVGTAASLLVQYHNNVNSFTTLSWASQRYLSLMQFLPHYIIL